MKKIIKRCSVAALAVGVFASNAAMAALPAEVGTTVTAAKGDITEAGGLILGVVVTIAGIGWLRRVIK